ncbi:MAG TPA: hypothetical protein VFV17_04980 [Usitatibacteraceae bacterium]|nr:hypothetical protein [Usitatibacteraceae bacterium]
MTLDISRLSAAELDDLIDRAAKRRLTLTPPHSDAQPQGELQATFDPKWYITGMSNGTLLQIKDPGHGWLNYIIAPASRAVMLSHMLQHALLPVPKAAETSAPLAPAQTGGGTLH